MTVNTAYIDDALWRFLKVLRKKRPNLVIGEWFLHWDNAPVQTAQLVQSFLAKNSIQLIPHSPYSPDLTPTDFFLFLMLKKELSGLTLTFMEFKTMWAIRTITEDDFTRAFVRWLEQ